MTTKTKSLSRRLFLKATTYASALTASGLSTVAIAGPATQVQGVAIESGVSAVTLLNKSNKALTLDAFQPFTLKKIPGWVVVKLNKVPELSGVDSITLAPGQQRSFETKSELAPALKETGGHIFVMNERKEFDDMVPLATFDVAVV